MDEDLIGYLLDAIEPKERRVVEESLRANPEAQRRLDLLRQSLEPLADVEAIEPPAGLWVRTLARVAEYRCRALPQAPATLAFRQAAPSRGWRRPDALVAAGILLCLGLLIPPSLSFVRDRANISACQNNLRTVHAALVDYSQRHHGAFPNVADAALKPNVAGMFVPVLNEEQLLPEGVNVGCPAQGDQPPVRLCLGDVKRMDPDEFARWVPNLAGSYAYSLGYADSDGIHGLRQDLLEGHSAYLPIMSDRPPDDVERGDSRNSPNHGGYGQNVLFVDGHCIFCTQRTVGYDGDDIFVNFDKKVAAGKTPWDAVLARSAAHP
jgi:prepilin-type processing-associated H-X9-DG protein